MSQHLTLHRGIFVVRARAERPTLWRIVSSRFRVDEPKLRELAVCSAWSWLEWLRSQRADERYQFAVLEVDDPARVRFERGRIVWDPQSLFGEGVAPVARPAGEPTSPPERANISSALAVASRPR